MIYILHFRALIILLFAFNAGEAFASARSFLTGNTLFKSCDESSIEHRSQIFPCSFIATFEANTSEEDRRNSLNQEGVIHARRFGLLKANEVVLANRAAYFALRSSSFVQDLIPNRLIKAHAKPQPSGPSPVIPVNIIRIGATPALRGAIDGTGIGIAILDTGVDMANADLRVSPACFTAFTSCQDGNGHGTHVSGIAAALDNNIGVIGVAPGATLYAVKVLDNSGNGSDATIMQGLEWILNNANSVDPAIRVVNASFGRHGALDDNPALRSLIASLKESGIAMVASAGNDAEREVSQMIPAGYPEVIAVASTTATVGAKSACRSVPMRIASDVASYFTTDGALSSEGIGVTISAPGEESESLSRGCFVNSLGILSLARGGATTRMSGTSMAAPHVSGAIALYAQQNASVLNLDTIKARLRTTASLPGAAPYDSSTTKYTFDSDREGVLSVCAFLGNSCP